MAGSRSDTTRIADVSLQIVRDCLPRFNAKEPDTAATQRMTAARILSISTIEI
jgi:hypothetical protein